MEHAPPAIRQLAGGLDGLGWVTDLLVAGALATRDYVRGVSDLDLVALTAGPVDVARQETLTVLHRELDQGAAQGLDLGCQYVDAVHLADHGALHPTWTHGALVQRSLSGVMRAELVRYGFAVLGRTPADVLPEMTDENVRRAAPRGAVGVLGGRRAPADVVAEPGDRGPWADVDGTRPSRPADGPAADQITGDRPSARVKVAERAAPRPAARPGRGLATGPDRPDRMAGRSAHRGQRTPRGASKLMARLNGQQGTRSHPRRRSAVSIATSTREVMPGTSTRRRPAS